MASTETAQDRLQGLRGRLSRLEEIKEQSGELAEDEMREQEPELARSWDAFRKAQRSTQEQRRQSKQIRQTNEKNRSQGRELEFGE